MQFNRLNRREFIALLGGAAAWPVAASAQQRAMPVIGFLGGGAPSTQRAWVDAFVRRLRELGWIEGRTVAIEYRWGEGRNERYDEFAAEFVRLKVDVIFAGGTEPALAAKRATAVIPIVFPTAGDPVSSGLVASLARPGGNATGLSNLSTDLGAKRLELLREILPALKHLAVMVNADYSVREKELAEVDTAARSLGIEVLPSAVRGAEDIALSFEGLKGRAEGLYVIGDPLMNTHRLRINIFALAAHLPTVHVQREYVELGGLLSYGPNFPDSNRRAAEYVDKILRGAKPADLPVEQPTKFDLVINLITARALGLTIPPTVLARADEVIE
jgi:putative ABC transport system substrate-binding protein